MKIILASGSPFRKTLLENAGINFEVCTSNADESSINSSNPDQKALDRALLKGKSVATANSKSTIICADQVLSLDGRTFDKAKTEDEAYLRLSELSGKTHVLHSAFALIKDNMVLHSQVVRVQLHMRDLSDSEIKNYLSFGEWRGCVGCYQYENRGINLFNKVEGEYSAIVGLPLPELLSALRTHGYNSLI